MQVSWIDSEHLKGLLRQLQDAAPKPAAEPQAWETHTLPEAPVELALPVETLPSPPVETVAGELSRESETETPAQAADLSNAPEVARIRDRLREVRERAEAAGLLKKSAPPSATMAAPALTDGSTPAEPTETHEPTEPKPASDQSAQTGFCTDATTEEINSPANTASELDTPADAAAAALADSNLYFEVPLGSVLERLDAFAEWARQRVAPAELLLLDEHGDLLLGAEARAELVLSVMLAAKATQRSSAAGVCETAARAARQPAPEGGGELVVISCPTRLGLIHLAIDHPSSLPESEAQLLRQALMSAVDVAA